MVDLLGGFCNLFHVGIFFGSHYWLDAFLLALQVPFPRMVHVSIEWIRNRLQVKIRHF